MNENKFNGYEDNFTYPPDRPIKSRKRRQRAAAVLLQKVEHSRAVIPREDTESILNREQFLGFAWSLYRELGSGGLTQFKTALLFIAAGVEPEEFL